MPDIPTPIPHDAAAIRAAAFEEAARIAEWAHMVPPGGGSPSEAECEVAKAAAAAIRARASNPTDDHKPPVCDNPPAGGDHKRQSGGVAARDVLREVEWVADGLYDGRFCPKCCGKEPNHAPDCRLAAALDTPDREADLRAEVERLRAPADVAAQIARDIERRYPTVRSAMAHSEWTDFLNDFWLVTRNTLEFWNRSLTLEARVKALKDALRPFAVEAVRLEPSGPDESTGGSCQIWQIGPVEQNRSRITYAALRRARAVLAQTEAGRGN